MGDKKAKLLKKEIIKEKGNMKKETISVQEKNVVQRIKKFIISEKVNSEIKINRKELLNYDWKNISINRLENEKTKNKKDYNKIIIQNNRRINNSKYGKNRKNLFYLNFIIIILLFLKKYKSSKIELTISGPGISKIFNNKGLTLFPSTNFPNQVYINNILQTRVNLFQQNYSLFHCF